MERVSPYRDEIYSGASTRTAIAAARDGRACLVLVVLFASARIAVQLATGGSWGSGTSFALLGWIWAVRQLLSDSRPGASSNASCQSPGGGTASADPE